MAAACKHYAERCSHAAHTRCDRKQRVSGLNHRHVDNLQGGVGGG